MKHGFSAIEAHLVNKCGCVLIEFGTYFVWTCNISDRLVIIFTLILCCRHWLVLIVSSCKSRMQRERRARTNDNDKNKHNYVMHLNIRIMREYDHLGIMQLWKICMLLAVDCVTLSTACTINILLYAHLDRWLHLDGGKRTCTGNGDSSDIAFGQLNGHGQTHTHMLSACNKYIYIYCMISWNCIFRKIYTHLFAFSAY